MVRYNRFLDLIIRIILPKDKRLSYIDINPRQIYMQNSQNPSLPYLRYQKENIVIVNKVIPAEMPVTLTYNSEPWLTIMCTPNYLEALAIGFLFNEGLISSDDEVAAIRVCPSYDNVDVWLSHPIQMPVRWRHTSGCTGGTTSIEAIVPSIRSPKMSVGNTLYPPDKIFQLIENLFDQQDMYRQTGGVHTSSLTDGKGIFVTCEDIGRHNTLDKIAGRCLLDNIHLNPRIMLTTGRVSSDMLQKAIRLGANLVISRTSPTSLSIDLAEQEGITLIGYAHRDRFNLYTHPEAIELGSNTHPPIVTNE